MELNEHLNSARNLWQENGDQYFYLLELDGKGCLNSQRRISVLDAAVWRNRIECIVFSLKTVGQFSQRKQRKSYSGRLLDLTKI